MSNIPKSQITFTVDGLVYTGLSRMAKTANVATGRMALRLFEAAYSARCKPTGDVALDAEVAKIDAPGDDALRGKIKELSDQIVDAGKRDKLLVAANTEIENLSVEIARLRNELAAKQSQALSDATSEELIRLRQTEIDQAKVIADLRAEIASVREPKQTGALRRFLTVWSSECDRKAA